MSEAVRNGVITKLSTQRHVSEQSSFNKGTSKGRAFDETAWPRAFSLVSYPK